MVRDHRLDELYVTDRGLRADAEEEEHEGNNGHATEDQVDPQIWVHAAHHEQLDDSHRRGHKPRHIELVDVRIHVRETIDHRGHQDEHG